MVFSKRFINATTSPFVNINYYKFNFYGNNLVLGRSKLFNRYLVTEIHGDELEIPAISRSAIERCLTYNIDPSKKLEPRTFLFPLHEATTNIIFKNFNTIIEQFFINTDYKERLKKATSSKGEIYYGGRGLIFDDNYNPLILCTLRAKMPQFAKGIFELVYTKPVLHVNPIVFIEKNKLINKGIINNLIPCYINNGCPPPNLQYNQFSVKFPRNGNKNSDIEIIVDNFDRFFVNPVIPKINSCNSEALNECLINNIGDVSRML